MREFDLTVVEVEDFLQALRIRNLYRASWEYWRFSCPFPGHAHGDEDPSAQMRDDDTRWTCHACKRGGNAITFLAEYEGVSTFEARRWLREEYGGGFREPEDGAAAEWDAHFSASSGPEIVTQEQVYLPEETLERYEVDWPTAYAEWCETNDPLLGYMFNRGFEPETCMEWQIGYDEQFARFTIPVRDEFGKLVGFKGRAWESDRKPKYLVMGDAPGRKARYGYPTYEKSLIVFGLDRAEAIDGTLILVEGELNAIAMRQKGFPHTVAISGSSLSEAQARLIRNVCDRAVIFFDTTREDGTPDMAGHIATWGRDDGPIHHPGAVDMLEPFMNVAVCPDHLGDPADMSVDDIAICVRGAQSSLAIRTGVRDVVGSS